MAVRGIRGAVTASANTKEAIVKATTELLRELVAANGVATRDIAAVFFTTTPDLNAEFPASAARSLGWRDVPLLCGHEMAVPEALAGCIRVMLLVNTEHAQSDVRHIYIGGAASLRPDLSRADQSESQRTS
ncbi:MAG TPA: chorismate mutase [Candidatus Eremiobacteraceae bacterium]|nr:chorismate mutase [Candidatus Eremiobacteraceae bacterium]